MCLTTLEEILQYYVIISQDGIGNRGNNGVPVIAGHLYIKGYFARHIFMSSTLTALHFFPLSLVIYTVDFSCCMVIVHVLFT